MLLKPEAFLIKHTFNPIGAGTFLFTESPEESTFMVKQILR